MQSDGDRLAAVVFRNVITRAAPFDVTRRQLGAPAAIRQRQPNRLRLLSETEDHEHIMSGDRDQLLLVKSRDCALSQPAFTKIARLTELDQPLVVVVHVCMLAVPIATELRTFKRLDR